MSFSLFYFNFTYCVFHSSALSPDLATSTILLYILKIHGSSHSTTFYQMSKLKMNFQLCSIFPFPLFFINFFFFYCLFLYRFFFFVIWSFFFINLYLFFPIFHLFLGRLMHLFLRTRILGKEVQILDLQMKYVTTFSSFLDYQICDFVWKYDFSNRLTAFIGNDPCFSLHDSWLYRCFSLFSI